MTAQIANGGYKINPILFKMKALIMKVRLKIANQFVNETADFSNDEKFLVDRDYKL